MHGTLDKVKCEETGESPTSNLRNGGTVCCLLTQEPPWASSPRRIHSKYFNLSGNMVAL
jgi:hypothetical protein